MSTSLDYFAIEQPLVARIKQVLPELQYVVTAESAEATREWAKASRVAHVVYMGDEVGQGSSQQGGGGVQLTAQLWMVVLAIKHAGTVQNGEGSRRIAGPLIGKLLQGLIGQQLLPTWAPLRRAPGPKVGYQDGVGYYPFVFRTNNLIRGKA
ncbi:phage tail terminator protein [Ralstonia mannitolilytica]|uniref:phage tail terminator protein n=1 Tax=Ralstonia mannitolilytica TaxID=105219 RepID=UPI000CEE484E|nr:hypothetical protein [Ralstonia mannitolilytica]